MERAILADYVVPWHLASEINVAFAVDIGGKADIALQCRIGPK